MKRPSGSCAFILEHVPHYQVTTTSPDMRYGIWRVEESPVADQIEPVVIGEVCELLKRARERWKQPLPIPSWATDGIHCAGQGSP
jgi:hypothetical protein